MLLSGCMSKLCVKSDNIAATNLDDVKPTQLAPDAERKLSPSHTSARNDRGAVFGIKRKAGRDL